MVRPPQPPAHQLVLVGVAVVLLVTGGALVDGLSTGTLPLLGAPGGEVWGHAWVQWWHADAWPGWPDGPGQWVTGKRDWPVIDPLPTFLAATVGALVHPILAYDLVVVLGIAGAFVGGATLARTHDGDPLTGGLALALAPAFLGSVASGLTEDLALGLAAAGLGWVGRPGWRAGLGAGLCLGVLSACGLVLAWSAAVAAVGLGLWAVFADKQRRSVATGLVSGALVAGVLSLPTAWMHADRLGGAGHRLGTFVPRPEPLWRLNPWKGVDLASYFVPGSVDPGDALVRMHPGYLGWSLVVLALLGGRSRWWGVLLAAVLLAPGPHLSFAGSPTGIDNPLLPLLHALPFGELVNHHGRLLLVGAVALAVLAARGVSRLQAHFGAKASFLALALVAVDLAVLGPVGAPLPTADPTPLAVYADAHFAELPSGAVLHLPAAGPGIHFQRPLLDQRAHRRSLALDPNRPGLSPAYSRTPSGRFFASLAAPDPAPAPTALDWPPGVAVVVVTEPHVTQVEAVLGTPDIRAADSAAWAGPAATTER